MSVLLWGVAPFIFMWWTWILYLAIMPLVRVKDTVSIEAKVLAYPVVALGLLMDFLLNAVIATALFLEFPKYKRGEWLFTGRVSRWNDTHHRGKRGRMARWICRHLLDPFDPKGHHCS